MAGIYNDYVAKLDKFLHQKNQLGDIFDKIETLTSVKRVYIAQGVIGLVSLYLIFGYFAEFVCNGIGFVYPAYASIHALESVNKDDDTKWLTYWVVFALFSVVEFFSDIIFSWFPLYWLAKVVFLIWCFIPIQNNGSSYIYQRLIRPVFLKNRGKIDSAVSQASGFVTKSFENVHKTD